MKTGQGDSIFPALPVNFAILLSQLVEKWGVNSNTLLAASGISLNDLSDRDLYINNNQYQELIKNAILLTKEPALGLHYGKNINISTLGIFGFAALSSANLEEAAEITKKYEKLAHRLVKTTLHMRPKYTRDNKSSSIKITSETKDPIVYRFEIESSFSAIYRIWNDLLGNVNGLNSIHFGFPAPEYKSQYDDFFNIPIHFNQTGNEVYFDPHSLKPLKRLSNPSIFMIATQQCELLLSKLEKQTNGNITAGQHVRQLLLKLPGDFLNQEQMAKHLNMAPRTLARQLEKENTSFQTILDEVKRDLALKCLTFTEFTVDEIAYILNYNDASNFTRAFKKWTGVSPSQYKSKKS